MAMAEKNLLLADDDALYCEVLSAALTRRDFTVTIAGDVQTALAVMANISLGYAVVDLQMPGPSGLELVAKLHLLNPAIRIVVLTGYASVATAVEAIKLGAVHYLTKPADADEVVSAFDRAMGDSDIPVTNNPLSVNRLQWEHIQKVLSDCNGNISEAARRLGMHRRTLQRKLSKRPVRH